MKNKIIVYIIAIVILLSEYSCMQKPNESKKVDDGKITNSHPAKTEGTLVAKEIFYDFGTISMKNGKVSKLFKINNSTSEDIKLPSLTTSCMCTAAYFIDSDRNKRTFWYAWYGVCSQIKRNYKSWNIGEIEAVYDPNAHGPAGVGMIDRFIYLEDANNNKLQFEIKANVTP